MKKTKKISLSLNKQVIDQLDKNQAKNVIGGNEPFTSIWGSNCNNSDPNAHKCCTGNESDPGACISKDSFHCSEVAPCGPTDCTQA